MIKSRGMRVGISYLLNQGFLPSNEAILAGIMLAFNSF